MQREFILESLSIPQEERGRKGRGFRSHGCIQAMAEHSTSSMDPREEPGGSREDFYAIRMQHASDSLTPEPCRAVELSRIRRRRWDLKPPPSTNAFASEERLKRLVRLEPDADRLGNARHFFYFEDHVGSLQAAVSLAGIPESGLPMNYVLRGQKGATQNLHASLERKGGGLLRERGTQSTRSQTQEGRCEDDPDGTRAQQKAAEERSQKGY